MINGFIIQDTLKQKKIVGQDTIKQLSDSSVHKNELVADSAPTAKTVYFQPVIKIENTDTTSSCSRNRIADVPFYDSTSIIPRIDESLLHNFPFVFTGINKQIRQETKTNLVKHLKTGDELPSDLFHYDWVLLLILLSASAIYFFLKFGKLKRFSSEIFSS